MDNVQAFSQSDEFHRHLSELNSQYGRGGVVAIVWDHKAHLSFCGMYICQLQYGQVAYRFRVEECINGYTLIARGRKQGRVSSYFY